jgi:hypothetical protein
VGEQHESWRERVCGVKKVIAGSVGSSSHGFQAADKGWMSH